MNNVISAIEIRDRKFVNMDISVKIVWVVIERRLVQREVYSVSGFFFLHPDVRACEHQPCQNNGTCVVYLRTYLCQCQIGFTGRSCEIGT